MTEHKMTRLEKVALTSAVSGAVFNVFLYGIGASLASAGEGSTLYTVRVGAAILQAAAFDLVAIATVMGKQHGRWSGWSKATAVASAVVSALIALDVAGVFAQPWLHAANALIVLAFTMHLLTPPGLDLDERARLSRLEQDASDREQRLSAAEQQLALAEQLVADSEQARRKAEQLAQRYQRQAEQRVEIDVIEVARYRLTYEQLAQFAGTSVSTVRRRLPELVDKGASSL